MREMSQYGMSVLISKESSCAQILATIRFVHTSELHVIVVKNHLSDIISTLIYITYCTAVTSNYELCTRKMSIQAPNKTFLH